MKYLAITAAALMLLAAPAPSYAQSDNTGGNSDSNAGNTAGGNVQNGNSDPSAANETQGENNACSNLAAELAYDAFPGNCRQAIDSWAMGQSGKAASFEGDVVVGTVLPDSVEVIEVPAYRSYGYVMLNDHRVLVDRTSRKVVRVY